MATCPNCDAPVSATFCGECGQRQGELRPSFRHVVEDVVKFLFRVDGKFLSTVRALLVPGRLTQEYFAGRKERYEKPLRLYVVTLALSLLVMPKEPLVHASTTAAQAAPEVARFNEALAAHLQLVSLVFVLGSAAALTFAYRKKGLRFAEHFIFMLHVGAQSNLIGVATAPVSWFSPSGWSWVGSAGSAVVLALALKRVHGDSWPETLKRLAVFALTGFAAFVVTIFALGAYLVIFVGHPTSSDSGLVDGGPGR